uniref:Uncharacterized protein n=1 Tax=Zygnema circumcarinatum TaxID=35869 RepID=Q32RJ0_ZYGCR|nr:hypothetical protein P8547_pgp034 [Zygnema circumcarinatum]AAX45889.1 hypothetical protein [Zygnema circumcarinatum]
MVKLIAVDNTIRTRKSNNITTHDILLIIYNRSPILTCSRTKVALVPCNTSITHFNMSFVLGIIVMAVLSFVITMFNKFNKNNHNNK